MANHHEIIEHWGWKENVSIFRREKKSHTKNQESDRSIIIEARRQCYKSHPQTSLPRVGK